ncbi:palmitoyl-acyl carrier protein thioesterase, chloroplastic-like [Papaver somniferum]|uniref:palmitoyl-acyl carrier protein thioesterase, chloroplastic-like n=1 Tax=Papaver somniferum TaxID=3469 RepID=UPI000E6FA015|nr:palmitoyl-acyl carrier protein thioesterase, chloroplastic-like [Papaver somniferum]
MDVEFLLNYPQKDIISDLLTDEEIIESVMGKGESDDMEVEDESIGTVPSSRKEAIKAAKILNRGDVVEIDTWLGGAPVTGFANHWLLRNANTGETLAKANSVSIMMNKKTRKLSKMPEEVRD